MKRGCVLISMLIVAGAIAAEQEYSASSGLLTPATFRPLPKSYGILTSRSIFARDGVAAATRPDAWYADGQRPGQSPTTLPTLRGVVLKNGVYTAIVEDPATHQTQDLAEGANLAQGRVLRITLRGFDFEADARVVAVAVGQDLSGQDVVPAGAHESPAELNKTAVAQTGPAPTTGPSQGAAEPRTSGGAAAIDGIAHAGTASRPPAQ